MGVQILSLSNTDILGWVILWVVLYMAGGLAVSLTSTQLMTNALPLVTATQNAQVLSGVINNLILVNIL